MALNDDVQTLVDFGIFNADRLGRLADAIRSAQNLAGNGVSARGARKGPKKKRVKFEITKEELAKARDTMTSKEIAAKYGVSPQTVAVRAQKLGLTTPRKKGKK